MTVRLLAVAACNGVLAVSATVRADETFFSGATFPTAPDEPIVDPYRYAWSDARMQTRIGVGLTLGGGVTAFTDGAMREVVEDGVGGAWTVRVSIGTHIPLGLELGYFGSAAKLESASDAYSGTLIGTTFEAALRYTILPLADGTPYVFAGAGWQRYEVRDETLALADTGMRARDDVTEFPLGAGIAYRDQGWVGDLRGTFRATTESVLLMQASGEHARLHSWEASASFGYEF
jgi:hypothetical protein